MGANNHKLKSIITVLLLAAVCLTSFCACTGKRTSNSKKAVNKYLKNLIDVDLTEYTVEAEMEITKKNSEEFAHIKIKLKERTADKVEEILKAKTLRDDKIPSDISKYQDHRYALEMKRINLVSHYMMTLPGGGSKNARPLDIYVADNGYDYFVYLYG